MLMRNLWIEMNQFRIHTTNNKCPRSKQSILMYEIESSVQLSFYLCACAMCKMNLAFRCEKKSQKSWWKKWEKCLPEIYITINKWRKSNFTLSFAPISSTCFFSCCTSRVVIEFQEYWCVFCMDCAVCLYKPKHKNTSICIVQCVSIFGIACVVSFCVCLLSF